MTGIRVEASSNTQSSESWLNTKLSNNMTVEKYRELMLKNQRKSLSIFIVERFEERYFRPIDDIYKNHKNGFTMMAIACLIIETLESFKQGMLDTNRKSLKIFSDFFAQEPRFSQFVSKDNWFYYKIRCGILHQAETTGGWKIKRNGELLDSEKQTINANEFIKELRNSLNEYAIRLESDDELWEKFKDKMERICNNCKS